jgi:tRNA/rRNA methyltransferase
VPISDWLYQGSNNSIDLEKMGLVFGPENTGLTNEDLRVVTDLVHIPTSSENPSMNLSHAVAVALFCFSQSKLNFINNKLENYSEDQKLATSENLDALEKLIFAVCNKNRFFHENTPAEIPNIIGNIFRRSKLSNRDIAILQGVFGKSLAQG